MKDNFTRIAIILDRSGSMNSCRESTVSGFNMFINEQKKLPGEAKVMLVQFDDVYETVFDKNLKDAPELTQETFKPRGSTALFDAQGRTIVELGKELESMPENERPSKVVIVTLTDGQENASKEFKHAQIAEMIKHQRENYNWDFVFLGANQDAIKTAAAMNIPTHNALTYNTSRKGLINTMRAASASVGASRIHMNYAFSPEERLSSMAADDNDDAVQDLVDNLQQQTIIK